MARPKWIPAFTGMTNAPLIGVLAASMGREISVEDGRWQNGAFTGACWRASPGKADYSKDGSLSIAELDIWLSERVKELTARQRHPVARKPATVPDFPVAVVR